MKLRIDETVAAVMGRGEQRRQAVDVGGQAAVGEELVGLEVLPEGLGDGGRVASDEEEVRRGGGHAVAEAGRGGAGADAGVGAGADAGEAGVVGLGWLRVCGEVVVGGLAVGLGWGEGVVVDIVDGLGEVSGGGNGWGLRAGPFVGHLRCNGTGIEAKVEVVVFTFRGGRGVVGGALLRHNCIVCVRSVFVCLLCSSACRFL